MIRVARREQPGFDYEVADLRELPFADASLAGIVCWYSLMYLAPSDRPAAFAELARVVTPGGYLVTAFKAGDSSLRRGGRTTGLGVEFDIYWLSPDEMERRVNDAGFATVFWGGVPPEKEGASTQGYLIARNDVSADAPVLEAVLDQAAGLARREVGPATAPVAPRSATRRRTLALIWHAPSCQVAPRKDT